MKIGILTYTREYTNLGTIMQCYCTLKAVQRVYPDAQVELIDYARTSPSRRPYLSHVTVRSVVKDYVRMRKYRRFFGEQLNFSSNTLNSADSSKAWDFIRRQEYDLIYVGSDTVLELKNVPEDRLTPYWLDDTVGGARILASASSHNVSLEMLSKRQTKLMERAVNGFSLLGVRDEATFRLLSHFVSGSDERLRRVPDPTFVHEIDYSHVERYLEKRKLSKGAPMVCLHLVRNSTWASALANSFRRAGYIVASLRPASYADVILTDMSPFEQLGIYKYFSLVITHRFHDTIFSLKNLTPVMAFPEHVSDVTPHGESKIATLLKAFGAHKTSYVPNNTALSAESLFERYGSAMSYFANNRDLISTRLQEQREEYMAFMERSRAVVQ